MAEAVAAQRIAAGVAGGGAILSTLLRGGDSVGPSWDSDASCVAVPRIPFFAPDTKFDIGCDDVVMVNAEATAAWRSRLAAELDRRQAMLTQWQPVVPANNGHNGAVIG